MTTSPVIDVHTHMLTNEWVALLEKDGGPSDTLKSVAGGLRAIHLDGAPFMTPVPNMFDWEGASPTWTRRASTSRLPRSHARTSTGKRRRSLKAARDRQRRHGEGAEDLARSHPLVRLAAWQHERLALEELKRACDNGAVGVMVLANIAGKTAHRWAFANIWKEIDRRALRCWCIRAHRRNVGMGLHEFQLTAPIGFTFDTSLAVARCIYDGFFDRYPNLKLIASHGGGALPYLVGRLDICWDNIPAARGKTAEPPRNCMRRIYVDSVVFRQECSTCACRCADPDNVLYGSITRTPSAIWRAASRASTRCPTTCGTRCAAGTPSGSFAFDPLAPRRRRERLSMHVLEAGDASAPACCCCTAPELAYSWRKVVPALADAGFYAITPDQRG